MTLTFWLVVFTVSVIVLVKAADYFTDSSEKLGLALGISPFIVGITIVSIGTSFPELISSIVATVQNVTEIVIANVIGSNLFNILMIIGFAAIFAKRLIITRDLINLDLPLLASFTALFIVACIWDRKFTFVEGIISLLAFLTYLHYSVKSKTVVEEEKVRKKGKITIKLIFAVVCSAFFVFLGAKYMVESVVKLSEITGIGTSVISLTAVAAGTSFPELFVSVVAAIKRKFELALGNILGSNIFNISLVTGISALIRPLYVSNSILTLGIPFLIIATLLMIFSGISKKIHNWEGAIMLLIYLIFLGKLFNFI